MFLLFIIYAGLVNMPEKLVVLHPEFPLTTLEECTKVAEELAVSSMETYPELATHKFYHCVKESI